jgi:hypothetical protein
MNGFFTPADGQELEAEAAPDEGKVADDEEVIEDDASGDEQVDPDEVEETSAFSLPLKVSGKDVVIESREEAIELAQKGLHYTQEMQKLRGEQAQLASEREQVHSGLRQQVDQYATALKSLHETYGFVLGKQQPDWASADMQKLKAEKPTEYVQIREQWDQLGAIRAELSRVEQERQADEQKKFHAWVAAQQTALADKRPEWNDASRRQQDFSLIQKYAGEIGISDDEINNLFDARFWLILHDAARYRQAEATGKKKVVATSKTVEPGSGKGINQGDRRLRAERENLRKTGDPRAAGNLLQELMTRKK